MATNAAQQLTMGPAFPAITFMHQHATRITTLGKPSIARPRGSDEFTSSLVYQPSLPRYQCLGPRSLRDPPTPDLVSASCAPYSRPLGGRFQTFPTNFCIVLVKRAWYNKSFLRRDSFSNPPVKQMSYVYSRMQFAERDMSIRLRCIVWNCATAIAYITSIECPACNH